MPRVRSGHGNAGELEGDIDFGAGHGIVAQLLGWSGLQRAGQGEGDVGRFGVGDRLKPWNRAVARIEHLDLKLVMAGSREEHAVAVDSPEDAASGPLVLIESSTNVWRNSGTERTSCTVTWVSEFSRSCPHSSGVGRPRDRGVATRP